MRFTTRQRKLCTFRTCSIGISSTHNVLKGGHERLYHRTESVPQTHAQNGTEIYAKYHCHSPRSSGQNPGQTTARQIRGGKCIATVTQPSTDNNGHQDCTPEKQAVQPKPGPEIHHAAYRLHGQSTRNRIWWNSSLPYLVIVMGQVYPPPAPQELARRGHDDDTQRMPRLLAGTSNRD